MLEITKLMTLLQPHLKWHPARLACFAALVLAVIRMRSVNLARLAHLINPRRTHATNYRRLQRFFALFDPGTEALTKLLLALRPNSEEALTLVMDRTEWKFGARRVNLLTVGYLCGGFTIPLAWQELGRTGNSNFYQRRAVLEPVLRQIGRTPVRAIVADRAFIGVAFLAWMQERGLRFVIRVRKSARIGRRGHTRRVDETFASLPLGGRRRLRGKRKVYGNWVHVVAAREGEDPWVLITNDRPSEALVLYGHRWSIETTFGAFKRRGFDLESTHLRSSERIERLMGVLSLALLWCVKVGRWRARRSAIKVKSHGRRAVSLFRYGLDYLQEQLCWRDATALQRVYHLLSCT